MRKTQVPDAQKQCIQCQEGITNPICPECLAREIAIWRPELKTVISKPFTDDTYSAEDYVNCLFCGREMSICAHCYTKEAYESVLFWYPEYAEEFIDTFNYGLREELK